MLKVLDQIMRVLLVIGCCILFMMMTLTAADVLLRYCFNKPITASYELSEIFMGVMAPIAILFCAYQDKHVCVDILFARFSPGMQRFSLIFSNLVVLVAVAVLAWQSLYLVEELKMFNLASATLGIPMWPVGTVFVLGFLLYIPVTIYQLIKGARG